MIQRKGKLLQNVQQSIIGPIIKAVVKPGTLIYKDEYGIYDRLEQWGYLHKTLTMEKMSLRVMKMEMDFAKYM